MNENIDLTKILKDCPNGFELYSIVHGKVMFEKINGGSLYPIIVSHEEGGLDSFTADGKMLIGYDGECCLFPSKYCRDWSNFTAPWYKKKPEHKFHVGQYITDGYVGGQITSIEDNYSCYKILDFMGGINTSIPFTLQDNYHLWTIQDAKDGDVLALSWLEDKNLWEKIIIFKKYHSKGVKGLCSMPCVEGYGNTFKNGEMIFTEIPPYYSKTWTCNLHPATKEQRSLFFQKMKEAGYKWNDETKTLEKLVEHRFDPKTLKPFDKIIARLDEHGIWCCEWFSFIDSFIEENITLIKGCGAYYRNCVPYNDDTKHLVGTTDDAPEYYRYWED